MLARKLVVLLKIKFLKFLSIIWVEPNLQLLCEKKVCSDTLPPSYASYQHDPMSAQMLNPNPPAMPLSQPGVPFGEKPSLNGAGGPQNECGVAEDGSFCSTSYADHDRKTLLDFADETTMHGARLSLH